jgi:putative RecB family exonuclease
MIPQSLSASAIATFSHCPARYKAEWIERVPSEGGSAANLGTSCHNALEDFVASGQAQAGAPLDELDKLFEKHYWTLFHDDDRLTEGLAMMKGWHKRQDWTGVTVLSTEKKQTVQLPTSVGSIPLNFIFDRLDQLEDGSIRVVDYKSNFIPMTFEDLRSLPQPQVYGMAARLMYPDAPEIWVQFDFLRHDPISVKVEREENRATWEYLKATAERIIASDGTEEQINKECVWCVRKHECATLERHIKGGGVLAQANNIDTAVSRRGALADAQKALKVMIEELDDIITMHMEHSGMTEFETPDCEVALSSSRRREVDGQIVAKLVGSDVYAKYADIKIGKLEELVKNENLSVDQATAVENQIQWRHNRVGIKVKPKGPIDPDEA